LAGIGLLAEDRRARGADIIDGPEDRLYGQRELAIEDGNGAHRRSRTPILESVL